MLNNAQVPVLGFVAPSGTGKTQLLKALIVELKNKGLRLAVIKHSHHNFEIDKPGKDSYELRKSGATQTLIASNHRWALIVENEHPVQEANLNALIKQLDQSVLDIILVEGFKFESFPKIEVYRVDSTIEKPANTPMFLADRDIIAVASVQPLSTTNDVASLDLNNIQQISRFIIEHFSLNAQA
jgi:molybdopterin-guanine dinucleotide biosynthesis adapter protein